MSEDKKDKTQSPQEEAKLAEEQLEETAGGVGTWDVSRV